MKGTYLYHTVRSLLKVNLSLIILLTLLTCVKAQSSAEKEADTMQRRIMRARALAALGNLAAARSELETLRGAKVDETVGDIARILLVNIYLEQGDYRYAEALLDETFKAHSAENKNDNHEYFEVAGQVIKGVRAHLDRYRAFGLDITDHDLLPDAVNDLDKLRLLIEHIVEQAKTLHDKNTKSMDTSALLEEAANVRVALARNNGERAKWQREVAEARQRLLASGKRIASISEMPPFRPKTGTSSTTSTNKQISDARTTPSQSSAPERRASTHGTTNVSPASSPVATQESAHSQKPAVESSEGKVSGQPVNIGSLHNIATQKVNPTYPPTAKSARVMGVVTVFLTVNEKGTVEVVQRSDGPELLRRAAEEAARRWKFKPWIVDGHAVRVSGFLSFNFTL